MVCYLEYPGADAIAAVDRGGHAADDTQLQGLRARLHALATPMDEVETDLQSAIDALRPYTDAAAKVDSDRFALSERETELAAGEAQLIETRNVIEAERRELRRARADHSDALVLARAVGSGADGDDALHELHRLTRDLKQSLRAAEDKVIAQDRQLAASARDQEDAHAKIAKLGEVNAAMREELRRSSKDADRRTQKGKQIWNEIWQSFQAGLHQSSDFVRFNFFVRWSRIQECVGV